jgi:hypothetical protein
MNASGRPLFILEMANNHMGDVEHGLALIRAMRDATAGFAEFRFAFKLQYRDLETFIHPSARGRSDLKYVKRFEETRLTREDFQRLVDEMRRCGFIPMCTPFDEPSVDLIERQEIDIIKIASVSVTDWPLLERIAQTNKPIVASTAGASLEEIDSVVSFFVRRRIPDAGRCARAQPARRAACALPGRPHRLLDARAAERDGAGDAGGREGRRGLREARRAADGSLRAERLLGEPRRGTRVARRGAARVRDVRLARAARADRGRARQSVLAPACGLREARHRRG